MPSLRVAAFNLENFDETKPGERPSLDERIALMRPQIVRLRADICCFQEVHGQERPRQPRALLALQRLLEGTNLEGTNLASAKPQDNDVYDERNIVVATHHTVVRREQLMNNLVDEPLYKRLTALPPDATAKPVGIERPVLHVKVDVGPFVLHVINSFPSGKGPDAGPHASKPQPNRRLPRIRDPQRATPRRVRSIRHRPEVPRIRSCAGRRDFRDR
jgi:hypothetical protein